MKVIEAFPFFNETDLLEIRLHEMDSIVDHFVIVESLQRHAISKPKPAYLRDNWSRFTKFHDKIKYVLLEKLEPEPSNDRAARARDHFQRNSLWQAIQEVSTSPDDVAIVTDCDEIPRASAMKMAVSHIHKGTHVLDQLNYQYSVNWLAPGGWDNAFAATVGHIRQLGGNLQKIRDSRKAHTIPDAGWHFSYFGGGVAGVQEKVSSWCHFQDGAEWPFLNKDAKGKLGDILEGRHVSPGRRLLWQRTCDPKLPEYFLKNIDSFERFTNLSYEYEAERLQR